MINLISTKKLIELLDLRRPGVVHDFEISQITRTNYVLYYTINVF